jgi:hypothetical protein
VVVRYLGAGTPSLVTGREYVVLALDATPRSVHPLMFMVHLPDAPITDWAWYEIDQFEVLDHSLPGNWVYASSEHGFSLQPAAWTRPAHWDDLFTDDRDRVERAWVEHRVERDRILQEACRPPGRQGSIGRICKAPEPGSGASRRERE